MASILISGDRLRALLRIEGGEVVDLADLRQLLLAAGIHFGLRRDAIASARIPSAMARELVVAEGEAPAAPTSTALHRVGGLEALPAAVAAGAAIAWREPAPPVQPGTGVDGRPIAVPPAAGLGPGLHLDEAGRVTARWAGVLVDDGGLRVDLPGGIRVREVAQPGLAVAADRGSVTLDLAPGELVAPAALVAALAAAGVVHGVDVAVAAAAGIPHAEPRRLLLARAEPAEHGGDDAVEHLIETASPLAVDRDQHIDFHRMRWLQEVSAGSELVRLHRGRPPRAGRAVDGTALPARGGAAIDLARLAGPGTRLVPGDQPVIVASLAGAYARDAAGVVSVSCPLVIAGNLDHHLGDVETRLPVVVRGDVVAGFTLICAEATVEGGVEDARVSVAGDLVVKGGLLPGHRRVVVHGRLEARHITGRPVRAASVAVATSIVDSEVIAGTDLACAALVSSRVIAGGCVTCEVCGDAAEARTIIELGGDPFRAAQAHEAEEERRRLAADAANLAERLALLQHHLHEVLTSHGFDEAGPIAEEVHDYEQRLATVRTAMERADRLVARHHEAGGAAGLDGARLVVRRRVHVGTEVVIGGRRCVVTATREGPSLFRLVDGELAWE